MKLAMVLAFAWLSVLLSNLALGDCPIGQKTIKTNETKWIFSFPNKINLYYCPQGSEVPKVVGFKCTDGYAKVGNQCVNQSPPVEVPSKLRYLSRDLVVDLIDGATKKLTMGIYDFSDKDAQKALKRAVERGVDVEVLGEFHQYYRQNKRNPCSDVFSVAKYDGYHCPTTFSSFMEESSASVLDFSIPTKYSPGQVFHAKFIIADGRSALISSGNFNQASFKSTRDYAYTTQDPALIESLEDLFQHAWETSLRNLELASSGDEFESVAEDYTPGWSQTGNQFRGVTYSPHFRKPLHDFLDSSQMSVVVENQSFSDGKLKKKLLELTRRGVRVKVVTKDPCKYGISKSKLKKFEEFIQEGDGLASISYINSKYLHSKAVLVDDSRGWVGSSNFSQKGIEGSRDVGVFLDQGGSEELRDLMIELLQESDSHDYVARAQSCVD